MFIMKWRDRRPGTMPSAKHFISHFPAIYRIVCYSCGRGMQKRQTSNKPADPPPAAPPHAVPIDTMC